MSASHHFRAAHLHPTYRHHRRGGQSSNRQLVAQVILLVGLATLVGLAGALFCMIL